MTEEMYDRDETGSALDALVKLVGALPEPFVLLGGWAVYHTVHDSYLQDHGSPYLGSRDIDVGFHVDPSWSDDELRSSPLSRAIEVARGTGYYPMGSFRYCRTIEKTTGRELTEEESKRIPIYDLFYLYLDIMVDRIHDRQSDLLGPKAMDEPMLIKVFDEDIGVPVRIGDARVVVPPPHLLLAMKLKAVPSRQKDDKILKDACDIYALIWHSEGGMDRILRSVRSEHPEECRSGLEAITDDVARRAAGHLGVEVESYLDVVRRLGQ
ncbi:MAG: hypothetical protein GQ558_09920 [Thermoplasmata archaeon]|nr:hypothetical protein [Thermoplasmata archaeon]